MWLSDAVEKFITSLRADGRSPETIKWYSRRVGKLNAYLGNPEVETVSLDDLRRWLADLRCRDVRYADSNRRPQPGPLSPFTIQGHIRCAKRLFMWLEESGYITPAQNVATRLKRQSVPRLLPKEVAEEDLRKLLAGARQSRFPQRDYAILLFLSDTGCRVGGVVRMRIQDLDVLHGRALLTEKGTKSRFVFLSPPTVEALGAWLRVRQSEEDFVFVNCRGHQLTGSGIYQILQRIAEQVGVARYNPHSLRHRFAKAYIRQGGDLATLSRLLGHSDVSVTSNFYLAYTQDELQQKHEKYSTLAGIV